MVFIPPEERFRAKERLPEKVLAESGRKVTENVALLPAGKVVGREGPVKTNSGRLADTLRTLMLWRPVFVSVMVAELAVLTLTDPKFRELGLTLNPALALTLVVLPQLTMSIRLSATSSLILCSRIEFLQASSAPGGGMR